MHVSSLPTPPRILNNSHPNKASVLKARTQLGCESLVGSGWCDPLHASLTHSNMLASENSNLLFSSGVLREDTARVSKTLQRRLKAVRYDSSRNEWKKNIDTGELLMDWLLRVKMPVTRKAKVSEPGPCWIIPVWGDAFLPMHTDAHKCPTLPIFSGPIHSLRVFCGDGAKGECVWRVRSDEKQFRSSSPTYDMAHCTTTFNSRLRTLPFVLEVTPYLPQHKVNYKD